MADAERLAKMGLDYSLVTEWSGRPQRTRKPPPKTYWEEYVATDPWYVRELVADVPADEWEAAVEAEDWEGEEQAGEEGDEMEDENGEEEEDPDYSDAEESEDDGCDSQVSGSGESVHSDVTAEADN
jgi:hypothetical protein